MTKEDAIKAINEAKTSKGVAVIFMEEEDVLTYGDEDLRKQYSKLTKDQKERFIARMMDEVYDLFEEGVDYGFGKFFREAVECAREDGTLEDMMK